MKIPAHNLGATSAASGLGRNVDRLTQTSARSDIRGPLRATAADRIDVGTEVGDTVGGLGAQERLDDLAARFENRIDHLMQKEGLSEEQISALGQAKEDFQALVDRLSNALDTLEPGVAARAFQGFVKDLRQSVHSTLHDGSGNVDAGDAARAGGVDGNKEGTDPLRQLDAVQARIESRFESYFSQEGLDERLVQELLDAKAEFESTLKRLHDAYVNGDKDVSFLRKGFDTALAGLRDDLASIFGGDDHAYGKPDERVRADSVALYGSDGGSTPLALPNQGSLDHIV